MLDMLTYRLKIFWTAFTNFPSVLSQNWFSILIPLAIFVAREWRRLQRASWRWAEVKTGVQKDSYWIVALYGLVFAWMIVKTAYAEHHALFIQVQTLTAQVQAQSTSSSTLLNSTRDGLQGQITNLRVDCGIKDGMNRTLQVQNRDQQGTINNCQTNALKLLVPAAQSTTLFAMATPDTSRASHATFLLLTNTPVDPVVIDIVCPGATFSDLTVGLLAGMTVGNSQVIRLDTIQVNVTSPQWTATNPIYVDAIYSGMVDFHKCGETPVK